MNAQNFIMMPIPAEQYRAVCAVLASPGLAAYVGGAMDGVSFSALLEKRTPGGLLAAAPKPVAEPTAHVAEASSDAVTTAGDNVPGADGEVDAHGHPWSPDLHASTKGVTKDGLWRMKVGVSRPNPLPGFPADNSGSSEGTGTPTETPTPSATSPDALETASAPADTSAAEDDEFAAFRAAAETSDATDAAAEAAAPTARQWSDADLGALCNQAAVKLGDPSPIKETIAQYVPEGEVAHSRNIPADKREEFAKAVETKAGVEFAG